MRVHPRTYVAAACTLAFAVGLGGSLSAFAWSGTALVGHPGPAMGPGWVTTWAGSPQAPTPLFPNPANAGFSNQTVRNIVFTSVGATRSGSG